jgi:hypothetical protein
MARRRHPKKEVERALQDLERLGWQVEVRKTSGHAWGLLRCPNPRTDCRCGEFCQMTINATPQNAATHAAKLLQKANGCVQIREERRDETEL